MPARCRRGVPPSRARGTSPSRTTWWDTWTVARWSMRSAPGVRRTAPCFWGATRTTRCGGSTRSECSCGTASAPSTSCRTSPRSTATASAAPERPGVARRPSSSRPWTIGSRRRHRCAWFLRTCRAGASARTLPISESTPRTSRSPRWRHRAPCSSCRRPTTSPARGRPSPIPPSGRSMTCSAPPTRWTRYTSPPATTTTARAGRPCTRGSAGGCSAPTTRNPCGSSPGGARQAGRATRSCSTAPSARSGTWMTEPCERTCSRKQRRRSRTCPRTMPKESGAGAMRWVRSMSTHYWRPCRSRATSPSPGSRRPASTESP